MSVNLSPLGGAGAQFFSNNGVPLAGGLLYTYLAGTSTPATTYTSGTGATALANPIILDAGGRVPTGEIWLSDGISYKFVLKDATDVLIATWDNLSGINSNFIAYTAQEEVATATAGQTVFNLSIAYIPGTNNLAVFVNGSNQIVNDNYLETDGDTVTFITGLNVGDVVKFSTATPVAANATSAANVSYTPAGATAVVTSVQSKLRESVSVLDFGADATGVTDSSAAFNAAFATGRAVYAPAGTYFVQNILMDTDGWVIYGDGVNRTTIKTDATNCCFEVTARCNRIAHMTIYAPGNTQDGIRLGKSDGTFAQYARIEDIRFVECENGIYANGTNNGYFEALFFESCTYGVHLKPVGAIGGDTNGNTFSKCAAYNCGVSVWYEANPDGGNAPNDNVLEFTSEAATDKGFDITGSRNMLFIYSDNDTNPPTVNDNLVAPNVDGGANFIVARNPDNYDYSFTNAFVATSKGGVYRLGIPFVEKTPSSITAINASVSFATGDVAGYASDAVLLIQNTTGPTAVVGLTMEFFVDVPVGFKVTFVHAVTGAATAGFLFNKPAAGSWTLLNWTNGQNLLGFAAYPNVTFIKTSANTILKL